MKLTTKAQKAKKLRITILLLLAFIGIFAMGPVAAQAANYYVPHEGEVNYKFAFEVLTLVNAERAKVGAAALKMDTDLLAAAMLRSSELPLRWSHDRPNGGTCFTASSKMYGENIAAGQGTPQAVMNSWMNSPGHKENILNTSYKSIGIGYTRSATWKYSSYWTQCFGTGTAAEATTPTEITSRIYDIEVSPTILPATFLITTPNKKKAVNIGETLVCSLEYKPNADIEVIIPKSKINFTSSAPSIASVDATGKITAVTLGNATITASTKTTPASSASTVIMSRVLTTYKIAFNKNGGKGKMKVQNCVYDKSAKLIKNKFKAPKGKKFKGWATSKANAKKGKIKYKNAATVKNLTTINGKTITLYAVWKRK
ncbi:MAG: CAP domain-containing protein [Anaerovoracaceae bacterium]